MKYTVLFLMMFNFWSAQGQVQNGAFNLTLKTLLSHNVPEVSVPEAIKMKDVIFLDAREEAEYKVSHLAAAVFVGYEKFKLENVSRLEKNSKIIVYCSVGYRSEKIAEKMKAAGFSNVSNLYGGIFEWVNQENPVVDTDGQETKNVHAYNKTWGVWLNKGNKVYDSK